MRITVLAFGLAYTGAIPPVACFIIVVASALRFCFGIGKDW